MRFLKYYKSDWSGCQDQSNLVSKKEIKLKTHSIKSYINVSSYQFPKSFSFQIELWCHAQTNKNAPVIKYNTVKKVSLQLLIFSKLSFLKMRYVAKRKSDAECNTKFLLQLNIKYVSAIKIP